MNVQALVYMLCSALFCMLLYGVVKKKLPQALAMLLCILPLAVICSKLVYCLIEWKDMMADGIGETLFSTDPTHWSFLGGAVGVCLAVVLYAKVARLAPMNLLNEFAPFGALMAAFFRLGAGFYVEEGIGLGQYVEEGLFTSFPFSVTNSYDEHYFAIFILETLLILVVAILSWKVYRRDTFLRTVYALCMVSILCESMKTISLMWLLMNVEQFFSMLIAVGVLIVYARKTTEKGRYRPFVVSAICAVLFIVVMFALDRSPLPRILFYGLLLLGIAAMMITEKQAYARKCLSEGRAD